MALSKLTQCANKCSTRTCTQLLPLLSRSPHARPRLSRSMFQFSKIWTRMKLGQGQAPMPIFTAVRIRHRTDSKSDQDTSQEYSTHRPTVDAVSSEKSGAFKNGVNSKYQWWEISGIKR